MPQNTHLHAKCEFVHLPGLQTHEHYVLWRWFNRANSFERWWFVGGICTPCFECQCNGDAVDASCPRERCPLQPSREIRFLQGSFTQFRNLSASAICVYTLDIQGSQFRETQLVLEHASSSSFLPDPIAFIVAIHG
jgi:hypothetical protein